MGRVPEAGRPGSAMWFVVHVPASEHILAVVMIHGPILEQLHMAVTEEEIGPPPMTDVGYLLPGHDRHHHEQRNQGEARPSPGSAPRKSNPAAAAAATRNPTRCGA